MTKNKNSEDKVKWYLVRLKGGTANRIPKLWAPDHSQLIYQNDYDSGSSNW